MRVPLLAQHLEPSLRLIEEMSAALEEEQQSKKKIKWQGVSSQKEDTKYQIDPTATAMPESTPEVSISFRSKIFAFLFSPLGIACIFIMFNMSIILGLGTSSAETVAVHPNSVKGIQKEVEKQVPGFKTRDGRFVHADLGASTTNATNATANAAATKKVSFKIPFLDSPNDHDCTKPISKFLIRDCRLEARKTNLQPIIYIDQTEPMETLSMETLSVDTDCFVWSRKCRQRKRIAAQMLSMSKDAE
jgi:hypothetical protein